MALAVAMQWEVLSSNYRYPTVDSVTANGEICICTLPQSHGRIYTLLEWPNFYKGRAPETAHYSYCAQQVVNLKSGLVACHPCLQIGGPFSNSFLSYLLISFKNFGEPATGSERDLVLFRNLRGWGAAAHWAQQRGLVPSAVSFYSRALGTARFAGSR